MDKIKHFNNSISQDGILFLQGVFKKDCQKLEDMFKGKIMSDITTQELITYDKVPMVFTTLQDWPKSTNLACWHCTRTFKSRPWFAPQSIEPQFVNKDNKPILETKKANIITAHGNFCSCHCVMAYILIHSIDLIDRLNKIAMLKFLYELFIGHAVTHIHPSPSPHIMIQYGGTYTPTMYQQKIDSLDTNTSPIENTNFASLCNVYMKSFEENN